jgi:hypothetical protein
MSMNMKAAWQQFPVGIHMLMSMMTVVMTVCMRVVTNPVKVHMPVFRGEKQRYPSRHYQACDDLRRKHPFMEDQP